MRRVPGARHALGAPATLRECGHIGCCDNSPGRHATGHFHETSHPIIQSFEPGEDWYWCYVDELAFELNGYNGSPSHT